MSTTTKPNFSGIFTTHVFASDLTPGDVVVSLPDGVSFVVSVEKDSHNNPYNGLDSYRVGIIENNRFYRQSFTSWESVVKHHKCKQKT